MKRIDISASAEKEFKALPEAVRRQMAPEIEALAANPLPIGCKKLKANAGYRIRHGRYRIVYLIGAETVLILRICHRKDAYR